MAAKKVVTKKAAAKKAAVKKAAVQKAAVQKPAATHTIAKKVAANDAAVMKAPARKSAAKKAPQSMPYEQGKWAHVFAREADERRYWLLKSEPDVFSFQDLQAAPKHTTGWDSVRNSGARNFMRDAMKRGDLCFYYHSNAEPSAIVGVCEVVREGYPDHTALDPSHDYYDADSVAETPTWFMVDVRAVEALPRPVTLPEIKASAELREMALIKVGRLSVVPVTKDEWETVLRMSRSG